MSYWMLAETKKIVKNRTLTITLLLSFAFMIYILFDPFPYKDLHISTYISSVFLLSLTIFGALPMIVMGAFLSYQEYSWNTFQYLANTYSRTKLYLIKSSFLFIASFILPALTVIFAVVIHFFIGVSGNSLSFQVLMQYFTVSLFCFFWGYSAFILSLLTKSAAFSIVALFLLSFFEPAFYMHMQPDTLSYLILFNQKGLLASSFSNLIEGSYLIVPEFDYPSTLWSASYNIGIVLFVSLLGFIYIRRTSIPS